jgi:hypothetical protein
MKRSPGNVVAGGAAKRRIVVRATAASAIATMGIVGVAADASAKPPRDTTNNKTCTQLRNDVRIAWESYTKATDLFVRVQLHRAYQRASREADNRGC